MWALVQATVLFAFMAIVQVKNQRRLKKFKVSVVTRDSMMIDSTYESNMNRQTTTIVDTPWNFWKWLIVIY